jgi:site-specific DNA recombinase
MAECRGRKHNEVRLEYAFDRLLPTKLQQVYELLVPDRIRMVGERSGLTEGGDGHRGDLRAGVLGQAEGGEHHRQPDSGADRLRPEGHRYRVPDEWIFEDQGYSGTTLVRPGLERVRDLAAEGQINAVLVYSPDRLSRKYAYQILLVEELARAGVETVFIMAPRAETAEDRLLQQFQGMIAEYERAQILERSRRGKRHRARQGQVSVLSGAPYGYRYVRRSDEVAAYYEVIEAEAAIVRMVYDRYIAGGLSIGAITRLLNERQVPTRKQISRWERSTVWAMLRNPAYSGTACFGKTRVARRQRITRPLRLRQGVASRDSASHERPRNDWIEIAVPAIVADETFARAQELLAQNKVQAPRRTVTPSIVQGLVACSKCGYALSRTSTRSTARLIHY